MKKIVAAVVLYMLSAPLFAQTMVLSAGYTSASIRYHDVEEFGTTLKDKNNGTAPDIAQTQRGFDLGLAFQAMDMSTGGVFLRTGLNFSKQRQKKQTLADGSDMQLRSSATDGYVALGVTLGSSVGSAAYLIMGGTYTTGRLDLGGNWSGLEGRYRGQALRLTYGAGFGLYGESGLGLSLDLYCNFSNKNANGFMENGDAKLPVDYATYIAKPAEYTGSYVRPTNGYIRAHVALHIPLGK